MGTHINDVYYCNLEKIPTINERIFSRNRADTDLEKLLSCRPVKTRQVEFPMLDCKKRSSEPIHKTVKYNTNLIFNPSAKGPYSGYNVDLETQLFNQNTPLQKCVQNKYIPSSQSDLYNNNYLVPSMGISNMLIQKKEKFNSFNPNKCRLGLEMFNNSTRQQTKNVKLQ